MIILSVETSADETAAAITEGLNVISSVRITQEIHGQWGGMVPSLAKRDHEKNIDWVIAKAMGDAQLTMDNVDVIGVTQGPGLSIALGVGIQKAKELAKQYNKPIIAVNHIEGHALSALADTNSKSEILNLKLVEFPCAALVISGGHTQVIEIKEIGKYKILAESLDDNIGEALDKAARMLGLPYPGGAAFEKLALLGNPKKYPLPLPMAGKEDNRFSYSGLKAAFYRLVAKLQRDKGTEDLSDEDKQDLAASFQSMVFKHVVRITKKVLEELPVKDLLVGGGVAANMTLRDKLCEMGSEIGIRVRFPSNMMLCTDNAAMIGVVAGFKAERGEFSDPEKIDRLPRWRVDAI